MSLKTPRPDYRRIVQHYEDCLAKHGDSHKGVDWPDPADARTRYRVMLEVIRPGSCSTVPSELLDFGCGASHLYEFIVESGREDLVYSGLDISPAFMDLSRAKFPSVRYFCLDVLEDDSTLPQFDYVVMNGVFTEKRSLPFEDMWQYCQEVLARVFAKSRRGIAFNVMSKHVDWEREDLFHLPHDLLAAFLTRRLTRNYIMRNDYGLYEYTTYVYR